MNPVTNPDAAIGSGFTFAFQPIVDTHLGAVYSHEALVRGLNNEPALVVLQQYAGESMIAFDAACRVKAIAVAARIGMHTHLNLNFLPSAVLSGTDGMRSTIEAAERYAFPLDKIILEASEVEAIGNPAHFASVVNEYRRAGIRLAIDDFGAGYAGLSLLAEFQPEIVKLDMSLVRGIHAHGPRQAIVRGISQVCEDLGIDFVVEGVETMDEFAWFNELGTSLYQGYLFAKPMFEGMPDIYLPPPKA